MAAAAPQSVSPILFQHEDGRFGLAATADLADFTIGDPGWHRVPLDEVHLVTASAYAELWEEEKATSKRLREALLDLIERRISETEAVHRIARAALEPRE